MLKYQHHAQIPTSSLNINIMLKYQHHAQIPTSSLNINIMLKYQHHPSSSSTSRAAVTRRGGEGKRVVGLGFSFMFRV